MKLSPKYLFFGAFIGLGILWGIIRFLPDNKLHIVFCDVGQGDAIYLRFPDNTDLLVDGGPNDKVLTCLGRYMPFYDRKIDLIVATHPQTDHVKGLISVVDRYMTEYFLSSFSEKTNSQDWLQLLNNVILHKIPVKSIYSGMTIKNHSAEIISLWPEKAVLSQNILGVKSDTETNIYSPYLLIKYDHFQLLLTGDGEETIQQYLLNAGMISGLGQVQVLKVPHHGSKKSINETFLNIIKPQLSIISVGKNSYGHPVQETIAKLESYGKVLRTDKQGTIEVVSDGNKFWVTR